MSNQVGLILSFLFLSFFILLSGEIITYQQVSVKAMAYTNDIAIYIQNFGYDQEEIEELKAYSYFDSFSITLDETNEYFVIYNIETIKEYETSTKILKEGFNEIKCNISVTRKEK